MIDYADVKQFAARYSMTHDLMAGQLIERGRMCSICDRWFEQQQVDTEWLTSMRDNRPDLLKVFLKTCEVEVIAGVRIVHFPARCYRCDRARLQPSPAPIFQGATR